MLSSKKLRAALFWLSCFLSPDLFAAEPRYLLILQVTDGESHPYVGSVTINDDMQALAAQVFFPGGHVVLIEMDILPDGHTVDMQIDLAGQTYDVTHLVDQPASPIAQAVRARAGHPSSWFAAASPALYQFQLPAMEPREQIRMDKRAVNKVGDIQLRFNRRLPPAISNLGYTLGSIMLNPGTGTSGRSRGAWQQMTDVGLLQLIELLVVTLTSPQLVGRSRFSTALKRDRTDPGQRVVLRIDETSRGVSAKKDTVQKDPMAQGYILWILEAWGWVQQFVYEAPPVGYSRGGYGTLVDQQGRQKSCYIQPFANPMGSGVDATVAHLLEPFAGMNIGTPPHNCRDGNQHWRWDRGFGGGPGSGWGGGGGFSTR